MIKSEEIVFISRDNESTIITLKSHSITIEDPYGVCYEGLFSVDDEERNNLIQQHKTQIKTHEKVK